MLQKLRSVRQSELFRGVSAEVAAEIEATCRIKTFSTNEVIHPEGELAVAIFYVVNGLVRLTKTEAASGREADVSVCEPGETFGEYLLIEGVKYVTAARAADVTDVAIFDLIKLRKLAGRHPILQTNAARIMSRHLSEAFRCISADRLQTAPQRVANYFLGRCPEGAAQASFRLPFQKRILAGKLGLAPEALSRAFATLGDAGVNVHGRTVNIQSVASLRAAC
ncbi:Crp/Fnr family transcriptional regulator [Rhizobium sp. 18055]|uniref:Crp/Fnr family transcriptional regulator n=1 Tax=Rhizobium sp. 18055 TaxID=2681403 RepID=UPI00135C56C3|nr:Crp/Fnr family transcriptional regulator [Rhizobium sp. 18055]